ncbi:MAG: outer membrane lipoprotein-sorting protein [Bacillota bacterium]
MKKPTLLGILIVAVVTSSIMMASGGMSITSPITTSMQDAETMTQHMIARVAPAIGTTLSLMAARAEAATATPSASEIIERMERNTDFETVYYEARMEISQRGRVNTKTMRAWADEDGRALIEFTNKRDLGTRILKIGDDLWLFSPTADEEVRLSGEMLNQGLMGSDFSYQDALASERLTELYESTVVGIEELDGRPCYVLELVAREGARVSYYRRKMWVDTERYLGLREELYAPSGKLLKQSSTVRIEKIGERYYPMEVIMEDMTRKESSTRLVIENIVFDRPISDDTFTRQRLTAR